MSRFTVICALCEPLFDGATISGCVIFGTAAEAEAAFAEFAVHTAGQTFSGPKYGIAIDSGAESKLRM
jgi:hypothetical protein